MINLNGNFYNDSLLNNILASASYQATSRDLTSNIAYLKYDRAMDE